MYVCIIAQFIYHLLIDTNEYVHSWGMMKNASINLIDKDRKRHFTFTSTNKYTRASFVEHKYVAVYR